MVDLCVCNPPKPHIEKSIFGYLALPPPSVLLNACALQSSFLGMNCALCGIKHTQCKRKASAGVIHIWEDAPELLSDRERQEKRGWEPRIYPPTRYWFGEF